MLPLGFPICKNEELWEGVWSFPFDKISLKVYFPPLIHSFASRNTLNTL